VDQPPVPGIVRSTCGRARTGRDPNTAHGGGGEVVTENGLVEGARTDEDGIERTNDPDGDPAWLDPDLLQSMKSTAIGEG
jgi:hypothetical protein